MRIIPVLDLMAGRAVHAVAGDRARYGPLRSVFGPSTDPVAIARGLRDDLGAIEVYVADLDTIAGRAGPCLATCQGLADLGLAVWLDAGLLDAGPVPGLLAAGVARVVAGLESVLGPASLAEIVAAAGRERTVFSLDLRAGVPIVAPGATWAGDPGDEANLVAQAVAAGVGAVIRLDLASVGTGRGVADYPPAPTGRPGVEWVAGGGVAGPGDLPVVAGLGYSAVLVGSAIHDGRVGAQRPSDQLTIRTWPSSSSK